jgi:hypothetical protein
MAARHPDLSRALWRKSAHSSGTGQNCVEVAANIPGIVAIRDSKDPDGGVLSVNPNEWKNFLETIRERSFRTPARQSPRRSTGTS